MLKDAATIKQELAKPFAPEDLEWRLQQTFEDKGRGLAVPYVTNRAIQDRLDDVVGSENWHNEFRPWHGNGKKDAQICGISIYFEGRGFITKWDGAEDTDIEPVKGGLSDSMKRCAVQWGIGRVLYKMDVVWVDVEKRGRSWVIKESERKKLDKAYLELLKGLKLAPAQPGGLQAQLTPTSDTSARRETAPRQPKPQDTSKPTGTGKGPAKVTQLPQTVKPEWEYAVLKAGVQRGMNDNATTSLTLKAQDGKTVRAYLRGSDPALIPGALLTEVKLTMRQQDAVAFYVLESYEIMDAMPQAA